MNTTTPVATEMAAAQSPVTDAGQPSLDRFAAELSAMTEVAATTAESLNRRLHQAAEGENRAAAASSQLQEQLRLGARMLKAFQSQIARVENTLDQQNAYQQQVADTQAKIEQCFLGIESCVDKTVESVALRLAELAKTAVSRFDEGIISRQHKLAELDTRIAECAAGIDGICEMVEKVQSSVNGAVTANQHTLEQLSAAGLEARRALTQHDQARKSLASDLQALREEMTTLEQRGSRAYESAREALTLSTKADTVLRERLAQCDAAQRDSQRIEESVTSLSDLLVRLEPWEKLLLSGSITADGLPEPLAKVAGEVRRQISQDMGDLSRTMQDVAERVAQLASVAPATDRAATPIDEPEPHAPDVHVKVKKPLRLRTFNAGA